MTQKIQVTSEVGRLRKVLVHTPGPELLAVTPSTRTQYLYDDVIDLGGAREEHRRFTSILARFTQVYELREQLVTTLQLPEAREFLIRRSTEVTADKSLETNLADLPAEELVGRYIEGWRLPSGPFSEKMEKQSYIIPPLPNLFFTRDAAVVVGDGAVISSMRFASRWPEEALLRTLFGYHPEFAGCKILYDGSDERRHEYTIEGGDVHPLRRDVVLVGLSERTTASALDTLSDLFFANSPVTEVIALVLPQHSTAIHLDLVWTQIDRELCAVHPPAFRGLGQAPVLHRRKGEASLRSPASLFAALREVGMKMEPVYCGGPRWEIQEREQWASGCNFLAVAPGQILSYARNEQTLLALEGAGFRIVDGERLLLGDQAVRPGDRAVITFPDSELVRGGGGPRCMTCPLWRDEVG